MDTIYNVFKTEQVENILDHLISEEVGFKLAFALYDQHFKIGYRLMTELELVELHGALDKELSWTFLEIMKQIIKFLGVRLIG